MTTLMLWRVWGITPPLRVAYQLCGNWPLSWHPLPLISLCLSSLDLVYGFAFCLVKSVGVRMKEKERKEREGGGERDREV